MTLLWISLAALGCATVGFGVGYHFGHEDGQDHAYREVERHQRHAAKRRHPSNGDVD